MKAPKKKEPLFCASELNHVAEQMLMSIRHPHDMNTSDKYTHLSARSENS